MNYSEKDICILHLSDLHIINQGTIDEPIIPQYLQDLLSDINDNTKDIDEIIVVVTGDIADRAKFDDQKPAIIYFFDQLHEILKDKAKGIVFVPGNHDVVRNDYQLNCDFMNNVTSDFKHFAGYKDYMKTANEIRRMFGNSTYDFSFGVEKIECSGYNCRFINADTAWCTTKERDTYQGEIVLGDCQLQLLEKECRRMNSNSNADITFFVTHYPLAWLDVKEREKLLSLLLRKDKLNADIILCGHIHDVESINYSTHDHSLLTLITGIGWYNSNSEERSERRYSVYKINPARNTCDIIMRKSGRSGEFGFDYTLYTENREQESKKITYPLRSSHQNIAFIKLNTPERIQEQNFFISPNVANCIQKISDNIAFFSGHLTGLISRYKNNFYETFNSLISEDQDYINHLKQFQNSNSRFTNNSFDQMVDYIFDVIYNFLYENIESDESDKDVLSLWFDFCKHYDDGNFSSFLDEICQLVIDDFQACFPKDALIRTHFRKHDRKKDDEKYKVICYQVNSTEENNSAPKDLPWGGFVKAAFENKTSLVYSANKKLNRIHTDWQEFITIIPQFEGNTWRFKPNNNGRYEERPVLTFGISIKDTKELLQTVMSMSIIDFLKLENIISLQLDEYVHIFDFPM